MGKIKCKIIMLSKKPHYEWKIGDVVKTPRGIYIEKNFNVFNAAIKKEVQEGQNLYLVTDDLPIKEGDWTSGGYGVWRWEGKTIYPDPPKVIATTDKFLSLPSIPLSIIEQYVNSNCKDNEVWIEVEDDIDYVGADSNGRDSYRKIGENPKRNTLGEVIPVWRNPVSIEETMNKMEIQVETQPEGLFAQKQLDYVNNIPDNLLRSHLLHQVRLRDIMESDRNSFEKQCMEFTKITEEIKNAEGLKFDNKLYIEENEVIRLILKFAFGIEK